MKTIKLYITTVTDDEWEVVSTGFAEQNGKLIVQGEDGKTHIMMLQNITSFSYDQKEFDALIADAKAKNAAREAIEKEKGIPVKTTAEVPNEAVKAG